MLISIPVVLLWNVQIPLKRKLALAGILCLSIFMIIIAIIRIAAGSISNGQVDAAWAVYWLQVEACIGTVVRQSLLLKHVGARDPPNRGVLGTIHVCRSQQMCPMIRPHPLDSNLLLSLHHSRPSYPTMKDADACVPSRLSRSAPSGRSSLLTRPTDNIKDHLPRANHNLAFLDSAARHG